MGRLSFNSKTPIIPLQFWDDLYKAPTTEWPTIVQTYKLDMEQLSYVAAHRVEVFERYHAAEESLKSWNEGVTKHYSKFGVKGV